MPHRRARRAVSFGAVAIILPAALSAACRSKATPVPLVATATVTLARDKAPLGSPIDMTYRFVAANDAHFAEDYKVMVHVVDNDEQMIFAFDHVPPTPTSQWKPGETIEYTRTEFIPIYPYVGDATIQIGLYSTSTQKRLPLGGEDVGQHAYRVAHLQLQPQTENVFTIFKEGWHAAEQAEHNSAVEWQWTKKTATLAFKNPKKDSVLYLDVDNPGGIFEEPQQVQVLVGGQGSVVPKRFGLQLYNDYFGPKHLWEFPQATHDSLMFQPPAVWKQIIAFWQSQRDAQANGVRLRVGVPVWPNQRN